MKQQKTFLESHCYLGLQKPYYAFIFPVKKFVHQFKKSVVAFFDALDILMWYFIAIDTFLNECDPNLKIQSGEKK